MKNILMTLLFLVSSTAFSAEWSELQRNAESYFKGATDFPFIISRSPMRTAYFKLYYPVTKIELSHFENPFRQAGSSGTDLAQLMGFGSRDTDYVEMHMHTQSREINCSVLFQNAGIISFENCRTRELDYGSWMTLEAN